MKPSKNLQRIVKAEYAWDPDKDIQNDASVIAQAEELPKEIDKELNKTIWVIYLNTFRRRNKRMNFLRNLFSPVAKFFSNLFKSENMVKDIVSVIEDVAPYVETAYPYVLAVARLTVTKTDDEILDAYDKLGVKDLFDPTLRPEDSIRDLVKHLLIKDGTSAKNHILNLAIEMAYSKLKKELEK